MAIGLFVLFGGKLAPHHPLHNTFRSGLADQIGRNGLAVSKHGDTVTDGKHLIEVVRDEYHGDPVCLDTGNDVKQASGLAFRQGCGRLVQDQDPAFRLQRPGNFDQLAMGNPERADWSGDVHIRQSDCIQCLSRAPVHFLAVQQTEAVLRQMFYGDVFGDGEVFKQVEFLMNHLNAMILGVMRAHGAVRFASQGDLSRVVGKHARKDLDKGGFAGAVFSDERMNLAFIQRETDPVQCLDATEMLFQTLDRQESTVRCSGGRCGKRCCGHGASSRFFDG